MARAMLRCWCSPASGERTCRVRRRGTGRSGCSAVERDSLRASAPGLQIRPGLQSRHLRLRISVGFSPRDMLFDLFDSKAAARQIIGGVDAADVERDGGLADGLVGLGMLREGDEACRRGAGCRPFRGRSRRWCCPGSPVVEGDVGEDGEQRIDDVGGVETASEAHFEDGDLDVALGEVEEGQRGEGLEEAGVMRQLAGRDEVLRGLVDAEVEAGEVSSGSREMSRDNDGCQMAAAVDADALVDANEMRRGVERGAIAGGGEDAGQRGGSRAFAVGPGDQDGGELALRIAQRAGPGRACGPGRTSGAEPRAASSWVSPCRWSTAAA